MQEIYSKIHPRNIALVSSFMDANYGLGITATYVNNNTEVKRFFQITGLTNDLVGRLLTINIETELDKGNLLDSMIEEILQFFEDPDSHCEIWDDLTGTWYLNMWRMKLILTNTV